MWTKFSAFCPKLTSEWCIGAPIRPIISAPLRSLSAGLFFLIVNTTLGNSQPATLKIIGGLAGVTQYVKIEQPFWESEIARLSGGRITAMVHPFDRAGLPGGEMLQFMQTGVVPFGTALLSRVVADEPALGAVDLPMLNPDVSALRRTATAFRPYMKTLLKERYDIELLGVYTYPAQVVFCSKPFQTLMDLRGRRIRTSSVGQSEVMVSLGAIPVKTAFNEIVPSISKGVVDCAITGTMSGNEIGLPGVTSHLHAMAISWGVSIFGANGEAWAALSPDIQDTLRMAVTELEGRIWNAAQHETANGIACNLGAADCQGGQRGTMALVPLSPGDEAVRRTLLKDVALPGWLDRCGASCAEIWNATIGPSTALFVHPDRTISANPPASR